jgi:membrane-associated phospholipid phosphatase
MSLYLLINYIGYFAPIGLFLLTLLLLRNMPKYLYFFVSGFILNNILNVILKLCIKEPRPSKDQKAIEIALVNGVRVGFDQYGMPSGHAQNCAYCLAFVAMVLNSPFIIMTYMAITLSSLIQRYMNNNHSALQLIVGLLVGFGVGYISYFLANKYITGPIKMRKDDNAPI